MKDASLGKNGQSLTVHASDKIIWWPTGQTIGDQLVSNSLITANLELCLKQVLWPLHLA